MHQVASLQHAGIPALRSVVGCYGAADHEEDPSEREREESDEEETEEDVDHLDRPVTEHHEDAAGYTAGVDVSDAEGLNHNAGQDFEDDRDAWILGRLVMHDMHNLLRRRRWGRCLLNDVALLLGFLHEPFVAASRAEFNAVV